MIEIYVSFNRFVHQSLTISSLYIQFLPHLQIDRQINATLGLAKTKMKRDQTKPKQIGAIKINV